MYSVSVTAPVNIATLKYWGKRDSVLNLPTNSSISVTLSQDDLKTTTTVSCSDSESYSVDQLYLNGKLESLESLRSQKCLGELRKYRSEMEAKDGSLPRISEWPLRIVSVNNFPTAAGLASSAAGYAAMVYGIARLYRLPLDRSELSKIARQGSGSACRSLYGGFVAWEMGSKKDGTDSRAVQIADVGHWPGIRAAILVVSASKKEVPSTGGMQLTVGSSDLFEYRVKNVVPPRYKEMEQSIIKKNFEKFAELTMRDSNSFHAVCLDSYPPIFYMNDTSKRIVKLINELNKSQGRNVAAYTFDAGPNAVIYYEEKDEHLVLGVLNEFFGHLPGWDKKRSINYSLPDRFPIDLFNKDIFSQGVSSVILTGIGEGPKETQEVLKMP
ncbi:diphosphomevalonate decarboxylase [Brettanomyces nanus]|uniref:Diphosphomevalonate decarboxylase n=1 Tax=Eeniella nana TaxID=13502 RepID=A0A875S2C2_EENNA|nr:diphosphomevalonate decarboxylase [Brettanomyces nanus]QPG75063.1 diphosphomevalonate decarboxylase [Brettanomyces nanus]